MPSVMEEKRRLKICPFRNRDCARNKCALWKDGYCSFLERLEVLNVIEDKVNRIMEKVDWIEEKMR